VSADVLKGLQAEDPFPESSGKDHNEVCEWSTMHSGGTERSPARIVTGEQHRFFCRNMERAWSLIRWDHTQQKCKIRKE